MHVLLPEHVCDEGVVPLRVQKGREVTSKVALGLIGNLLPLSCTSSYQSMYVMRAWCH
jgi:hypothetical protein